MTGRARMPLEGVRVVEMGTLIAGPFGGRLLSDFGADVIKIEQPGSGDPLREWGAARSDGHCLWWPVQSRGKRLVSINLRDGRGQEICRELIARADVVIENFRPGTMERWGLGPEEMLELNPNLIYARVSGFGQDGPYSSRPGFASVGEAMSGLRYLQGFPGGPPTRLGISLGDTLSGLFVTIGILAAVVHRERTDEPAGQVIDASIIESCFAMLESIPAEYARLGLVRQPTGTTLSNIAPSNVYRSGDGKDVVIAANSTNLWPRLCRAMDREDLIDDPRFTDHEARGENMEELDAIISEWVGARSAAEVDRILNEAQVVCGPVYTIEDIFSDPHFQARKMWVDVEDPELGAVVGPAVTPKLSETPGRTEFKVSGPPGADNAEVFGELLDFDPAELERLAESGVI